MCVTHVWLCPRFTLDHNAQGRCALCGMLDTAKINIILPCRTGVTRSVPRSGNISQGFLLPACPRRSEWMVRGVLCCVVLCCGVVCVCMDACVHVCMKACTPVCVHAPLMHAEVSLSEVYQTVCAYMCSRICVCMYVVCKCVHRSVCVCVCVCVCACVCMHAYACVHECVHACVHTCMCMCVCTCVHDEKDKTCLCRMTSLQA